MLQYQYDGIGYGAGIPRALISKKDRFVMRPTINRERGYGQTPDTPFIMTPYKLKGATYGSGFKPSSIGKIGVKMLEKKHYDHAAKILGGIVSHLESKGYGHVLHQNYCKEIHGAGFFSSIKDFLKSYKIPSRLLGLIGTVAGAKYPALGTALGAASAGLDSYGYGKKK